MTTELWSQAGGAGEPMLLLLHGLGATAAVWSPLLDQLEGRWAGSWVACDLPGHGDSDPSAVPSYGRYAADVADLLTDARDVVVVGHSMGGVVALFLGTGWFGVPVSRVLAIGTRLRWSDDDLLRARRRAQRPVEYFATREQAVGRFVRVAGLPPDTTADSALVRRGVTHDQHGYRLTMDPAASPTARATRSPVQMISTVVAANTARVRLACGGRDPAVTIADLRALDDQAIEIPEAGHSPHLDCPAEVLRIIDTL